MGENSAESARLKFIGSSSEIQALVGEVDPSGGEGAIETVFDYNVVSVQEVVDFFRRESVEGVWHGLSCTSGRVAGMIGSEKRFVKYGVVYQCTS